LNSQVGGVKQEAFLPPEKDKQLKKACADFESLFVYELFKAMRRTIPP